jgi:hypothetical protein
MNYRGEEPGVSGVIRSLDDQCHGEISEAPDSPLAPDKSPVPLPRDSELSSLSSWIELRRPVRISRPTDILNLGGNEFRTLPGIGKTD